MANCGTLTIGEPFDSSKVTDVGCAGPGTSETAPGPSLDATGTIQNDNGVDASAVWELVLNGTVVDSGTKLVPANSQESVTGNIDTSTLSPGSYTIEFNVTSATKA